MAHLTLPGESPLQLYYEDSGGPGRPVVLIHGWPVSSEAWAANALVLQGAGYRVVAYDRRGFGQSDKAVDGYDFDTLAHDLSLLIEELDLRDAVLVGHSMAGGEVARYISTYGEGRLAGAVLASAITPALDKTADNPDGAMPFEGFAALREQCAGDRDGFLEGFLTGYFSNADGLTIDEAAFAEVQRLAAQASSLALESCILIWPTDLRPDVKRITVPTLVIHGDADGIVPFEVSGKRAAAMIPHAALHVVHGGPHGIPISHAEEFNAALLAFLGDL